MASSRVERGASLGASSGHLGARLAGPAGRRRRRANMTTAVRGPLLQVARRLREPGRGCSQRGNTCTHDPPACIQLLLLLLFLLLLLLPLNRGNAKSWEHIGRANLAGSAFRCCCCGGVDAPHCTFSAGHRLLGCRFRWLRGWQPLIVSVPPNSEQQHAARGGDTRRLVEVRRSVE